MQNYYGLLVYVLNKMLEKSKNAFMRSNKSLPNTVAADSGPQAPQILNDASQINFYQQQN